MNGLSEVLASLAQAWQQELSSLNRRYNVLSWSRALAFLAGAGLTWWLFARAPLGALFVGAAALIAFLYLIRVHTLVAERREHLQRKLTLLRQEEAILSWDWLGRNSGERWLQPDHDFSYDLDLFGRGSLFQYLHRHGTELGGARLAQWLQQPCLDAAEIRARQAAVRELQTQVAWQLEFQARGQQATQSEQRPEALLAWMQRPNEYLGHPWYGHAVRVLPWLLLLTLLLWFVPDVPALRSAFGGWHLPGWVPLAIFLGNLGLAGREMKRISLHQEEFGRQSGLLRTYGRLIAAIEEEPWEAPWLQQQQAQLQASGEAAGAAIERLSELLYRLDQRLNTAAALLLNGTLLWDLRYMRRLEAWKRQYRTLLPGWLEVIADLDAINGLARTAAGRPDLHFPQIDTGRFHYQAEGLGHILLPPASRVDNDVTWYKPGEFLIVTGANMAGKSTFLRTVGTTLVLAQMGAPVCAQSLRLVPIAMMTSIRNTDSLTDHESFFYAELKRLKAIIERLKAAPPLFIIVDEMLRGTNSRDKQEGSRLFIEQLMQLGGVGLVATHDLSLGQLAGHYPDQARNKRFEVSIDGESLSFDYQLLDGISQNLNATFLMQQMGIMPKR